MCNYKYHSSYTVLQQIDIRVALLLTCSMLFGAFMAAIYFRILL